MRNVVVDISCALWIRKNKREESGDTIQFAAASSIDGGPVTTSTLTPLLTCSIAIEEEKEMNEWRGEERSEILVTLDWDKINVIKLLAL